jgi:hypothetical protein
MVSLSVDLSFNTEFNDKLVEEEDDLYSISRDASKLFEIIHDEQSFIADVYTLFEKVMSIGVKELYYKEVEAAPIKAEVSSDVSFGSESCSSKKSNV